MKESGLGSYIDGKYVSQGCANCVFWTENRREGVCSQKVKTTDGLFIKRITFHNDVCSAHEEDDCKTYFTLYVKKDGTVAINGTFSKNSLFKMKEFIEEKIEKYHR